MEEKFERELSHKTYSGSYRAVHSATSLLKIYGQH